MGIILALIAGLAMAVQGVFNTRLMEASSTWVANTVVHALGLIVCVLIWLMSGKQSFIPLFTNTKKFYLFSGVIGVIIVFSVIKSIENLGPSYSVMLFLSSQLLVAYLIEVFGLFGTEAVDFEWKKIIGMVVIVVGIVIFKI